MTRGAEGRYAETAYAQWIKRRLEELGWQKKDLAAELMRRAPDRLGQAGADQLVRRATHGEEINTTNKTLIAEALGTMPTDPTVLAQRLEDVVSRAEKIAEELRPLLREAQSLRESEGSHQP